MNLKFKHNVRSCAIYCRYRPAGLEVCRFVFPCKQIGAATIVKANGKDIIIIYDNKDGRPFVKEIRADGVSNDFLRQFAGKNHDDKFQIGSDIKAVGVDEPLAKAIAEAVRVDAMTMQTLYGAPDKH